MTDKRMDMLINALRDSAFAARDCTPAELLLKQAVHLLSDIGSFSQAASGIRLRGYQRRAADAILHSVRHNLGHAIVVMFPRQSGKNELQAQIECYLLATLCKQESEIVKVSPTWKPQSLNAMRRLQRVLERNLLLKGRWQKESGYIFRLERARVFFFSGAPEANIVGATASTLLEVDEAQDVEIAKFDRDILPMAASTNATRVFWGTAWTSQTLLARELRAARDAEQRDGIQRAFVLTADEVSAEVPAYGRFVAEQVRKLGRQHPLVLTQYFSREIDAEGGMFNNARLAAMQSQRAPESQPQAGRQYAFLLDVAGADENASVTPGDQMEEGRDATALTIVEIDPAPLADPLVQAPRYLPQSRWLWLGQPQHLLYSALTQLAQRWQPRAIIVDGTGIGAGLASFLGKALPGIVHPFIFTSASKSQLGWDFLSLIDAGRWQESRFDAAAEPADAHERQARRLQSLFFRQAEACQYQVLPGPGKQMRWGVPETRRDHESGALLHDDLLLSAALVCLLDKLPWSAPAPTVIIPASDPLREMEDQF